MSQPVGTQSNAPKNQLPVFNPAEFIIDQTATQENILANENYIIDNNTTQSAQITANTATYNTVFPNNPTIYPGNLSPITSATSVWNTFFTQPVITGPLYFVVNITGTCSWSSTTTTGYIWIQVIDRTTSTILHNAYIYPNFNNDSLNNTVNIARQMVIKGTGNLIDYNIQAVTVVATTATFFIATAPSSPTITIVNLVGQS
jgi:hypothetical protein